VFKKFATGHPKFGAGAQTQKIVPSKNKNGAGWMEGFHWYERAGERFERTQAVGLKEWWAALHLAERVYSRRQTSGLAK
jgi:hypothetical protein